MKFISYIILFIGLALVISSILVPFVGTIGLILTLLGIAFIIFGILANKSLRESFIYLLGFFIKKNSDSLLTYD